MSDDSIPRCILILVCILLAGFFAASETALSYCNKIRVKTLADEGDKRAKRTLYVLDHFDKMLVTLLISINAIYILASSTATVLAVDWIGSAGSVVATVVLTLIVFMFSETIPKDIARTNSDSLSLAISLPISILMVLLTPVSWFFLLIGKVAKKIACRGEKTPTVTENEFSDIIETIEEEGIFDPGEGEIIKSAVEFGNKTVESVMTPIERVVAIDCNTPPEDVEKVVLEEKYSRIPVYDGEVYNIIGVVQSREILLRIVSNRPLRFKIQPILSVSPDMPLNMAFEEMSRFRNHIAIVRDKTGKTIGLVSMSDILEEIVGEIYDEDDEEAPALPNNAKEGAAL